MSHYDKTAMDDLISGTAVSYGHNAVQYRPPRADKCLSQMAAWCAEVRQRVPVRRHL